MNTKSNVIIGILAVAALVVGIVSYNKTPDRIVGAQGPRGEQGIPGPAGRDGVDGITKTIVETRTIPAPTLGAASPDFGPYLSIGGVRIWGRRTQSLNQASTTVCTIQAPAATSTLLSGAIRFDISSSTATTIEMGISDFPAATTTRIGNLVTIAANAQITLVASSTTAGNIPYLFAPNQYLNIKSQSATTNIMNPTGMCQATFVQI